MMTSIPVAAASVRPRASLEAMLLAGIGFQVALLLASLPAAWLDDRSFNGGPLWAKPLKFEASLIVNMVTLLLLARLIAPELRDRRWVRWSVLAVVAASTFEISYIVLQAARGVGSHYNVGTPAESLGYALMGIGAVILVAGSFVFGLAILRSPPRQGRAGLRTGAIAGLLAGSVLTLVTAGVLSANPGHWVGGLRTDATGLPLVGWSMTGGDLRVPHFFATHLMQALPVVGWLADRLLPRLGLGIVVAATAAGIAIVAATFVQALAGRAFWG
jgi:hypothetical protein